MYLKITLSLLLSILLSTRSFSQITLNAAAPNNGSGGVFLTLTTFGSDVTISKFNTCFAGTSVVTASIQVYTRPGAYAGFTTSNAGWTLLGTATATTVGSTTAVVPIDVTTLNIQIPAATAQSFYLHSVTTGAGLRYTGTGGLTSFSDANLQLFSDVARTGAVAFAGTANTPRTYAGSIEYFLTPLSLKWLNVLVKNQKNTAVISWEVEEDGVINYEVEKEIGNGHITITSVNSKGNGRNSYSVSDVTAFEGNATVATYRVKQKGENGQSSYSSSVIVKKAAVGNSLEVFPNPFRNSLNLATSGKQIVAVEDITGKTVLNVTLNEGNNTIETHNWPMGVYFIKADDGRKMKLLKR